MNGRGFLYEQKKIDKHEVVHIWMGGKQKQKQTKFNKGKQSSTKKTKENQSLTKSTKV